MQCCNDRHQGDARGETFYLMGNEEFETVFEVTGTNTSTIAGDGDMAKRGTGTLVLSGINSTNGIMNVAAGTLAITGQFTSPTRLNAGATLAGTGTIQNDVTAPGGTIAPGGAN